MCNIAGYIGKRQAAPILIEMMRREEGYAGGFFTGMTVHNGEKLVSAKVLGDLNRLLSETDCADFVGTCGFLHSRSNSGGGPEWGQPFLSADGRTSLIANGWAGYFLTPEQQKKRCDTALLLEREGYSFSSRSYGAVGHYPTLADGTAIHSTDIMCQYVTRLIDRGSAIPEALSTMMCELPCEVVAMMLREEAPDSIFVGRVNYPMTVGVAEDGDIYLATTPLAFPEDVRFREVTLLPASYVYEITREGWRRGAVPIPLGIEVAEITPEIVERALPLFEAELRRRGKPTFGGDLLNSYIEVWPKGMLDQNEPLLYVLCERLIAEGRLGVLPTTVKGAAEGATANRFGLYLK